MEGYSVTEAASVLGVPTERVWELLARGVLSGAPEGETGMRVFLQPRPAPAPPEPSRATANGGSQEPQRGELSPFRELLTEFRNLTERYGQALLALGEARGEVASLRSRVDLLEARMDLRLPPGGATTGWEPPMPSHAQPPPVPASAPTALDPDPVPRSAAAESEPASAPPEAVTSPQELQPEPSGAMSAAPDGPSGDSEPQASPLGEEPLRAEIEARAARRSASRHAIENFAEALARAEDPSIPELPGGTDAAAALAAVRATASEEGAADEDALPREVAPAEEVPVADEDAHVPAAAAVAPPSDPDSRVGEAWPEPVEDDDAAVAGEMPMAPEAGAEMAIQTTTPEAPSAAPTGPPSLGDAQAPDEPMARGGPERPEPSEADAPAWQNERYTAQIAEPDWFEEEAFEPPAPRKEAAGDVGDDPVGGALADEPVAAMPEREPQPEPDPQPEPEPEPELEPQPEPEPQPETKAEAPTAGGEAVEPTSAAAHEPARPAADRSSPSMLGRLRPAASAESEETVLWFGRQPVEEGEAALTAGGADEMEAAPAERPTHPLEAESEATEQGPGDFEDALAALDALSRATPATPSTQPPDSLRQPSLPRRPLPATPATRAYRRLRRIFPG